MDDVSANLKRRSALRIKACSDPELLLARDSGLEHHQFVHLAVPDVGLAEVDISMVFLGRRYKAPLLITSMAGGSGPEINRILATAAEKFGLALALGPGRVALLDEAVLGDFLVREQAPSIPLYAQLELCWGAKLCTVAAARRLVSQLDADALILRLNFFEEAVAGRSAVVSKGAFERIQAIIKALRADNVPVLVAEPGFGLDLAASRILLKLGVDAILVVGAGGISPAKCASRVRGDPEHGYPGEDPAYGRVGEIFGDWGTALVDSIRQIRAVSTQVPLVAGGGVRHGLDVAKLLALGCDLISLTSPFMAAAQEGPRAVHTLCEQLITELRLTMFGIGVHGLDELRTGRRLRHR